MKFLRDIKLSFKLVFIVLIPIILIGSLTYEVIQVQYSKFSSNALETILLQIELAESLSESIHELQKERGVSIAYLTGKTQDQKGNIEGPQIYVDKYISLASEQMENLKMENVLLEEWRIISKIRLEIKSNKITPAAAEAYFSNTIQKTIGVISSMGKQAVNVKVKNNLNSHTALMHLKENLAASRAIILGAINRDTLTPSSLGKLQGYNSLFHYNKSYFFDNASDELQSFYLDQINSDNSKLTQSQKILDGQNFNELNFDPSQWWFNTAMVLDKIRKIEKESTSILLNIIQKNAAKLHKEIRQKFTFIFIGLILFIGMIYFLFRNILGNILMIQESAKLMSEGEVNVNIEVQSNDEIGKLAQSLKSLALSNEAFAKTANEIGKGNYNLQIEKRGTNDVLANSLENMISQLRSLKKEQDFEIWFNVGEARLSDISRKETDVQEYVQKVIIFLSNYIHAQIGGLFLVENMNEESQLKFAAGYAFTCRKQVNTKINLGEGLIGQCAKDGEIILLTDVPKDYFPITSGLGNRTPRNILVLPIKAKGVVIGVIELGSFHKFKEKHFPFFEKILEDIGLSLEAIQSNQKLGILLAEANQLSENLTQQAEEMRAQGEELRQSNEELAQQSQKVQASEEELRVQQEELKLANSELAKRAKEMEENNQLVLLKNDELEKIQTTLRAKTEQLASSNNYKTEFLANMSHELRTPLNSILILSGILNKNKNGALSEKEKEQLSVIHKSGNNLLQLINDILDLSKIEAGKLEIIFEDVSVNHILNNMKMQFQDLAHEKSIEFKISRGNHIPQYIHTDENRIEQILKNLLSNAFKFTEVNGTVEIEVVKLDPFSFNNKKFSEGADILAISVRDTGVGIPDEKLEQIFKAFEQADGSTSRRYGGTGLGLSISNNLTALLGGEIMVQSRVEEGSKFTLLIPFDPMMAKKRREEVEADLQIPLLKSSQKSVSPIPSEIPKVQLPIEYSNQENPSELKKNVNTSNSVLIVEDNQMQCILLEKMIKGKGLVPIVTLTGDHALEVLKNERIDLIILDLGLSDMYGGEILNYVKQNQELKSIPVIVMTGKELSRKDYDNLQKYGSLPVIVKGMHSTERLEDELTLFLKKLDRENILPQERKEIFQLKDKALEGKTILIVDDDIRNIFALKSALIANEMEVIVAANGREALTKVQMHNNIDLVLMDVMMPEMDGYEATREIRKMKNMERLPIIAVTAKAMKDDRKLCLDAGASDYITKPLDVEKLLSLMRVWLYNYEPA